MQFSREFLGCPKDPSSPRSLIRSTMDVFQFSFSEDFDAKSSRIFC
jgi:hypothetical protein